RGLRQRRAALHAGLRHPARQDQRQRRRNRHGASAGGHRRDDPRYRAGRAGTPRSQHGAGDALHRRRHGHRDDHRAGLKAGRRRMAVYKNFTVETDSDGIALVTWDMPDRSMNVFTEEVMDELEKIVDRVAGDDTIKGAVITSGKESFSGGADLTMLQKMLGMYRAEEKKDRDKAIRMLFDGAGRMSWLWRKLETCGKPWVSAINGICVGGAFELSLACHGRVAADSDKVKMALPEVKVGIFPGAGGTQRVPRLTDTQSALQMLTSGQNLSPRKAKSMGLIHEIAAPDKLVETAKGMIKAGLKPVQPWDEKGFKLPGGPVYSAAGANLWPPAIAILRRETYGNYPAATAILK